MSHNRNNHKIPEIYTTVTANQLNSNISQVSMLFGRWNQSRITSCLCHTGRVTQNYITSIIININCLRRHAEEFSAWCQTFKDMFVFTPISTMTTASHRPQNIAGGRTCPGCLSYLIPHKRGRHFLGSHQEAKAHAWFFYRDALV